MKKTIWGYSVREVDENFAIMIQQKREMDEELAALKSQVAQLQAQIAADTCATDQLQQVQAEVQNYNEENSRLKQQAEALSAQLSTLNDQNAQLTAENVKLSEQQDEMDHVSEICRKAYQDMATLKVDTKNTLRNFSQKMLQQLASYEVQIQDVMNRISEQQQKNKQQFLESADRVLSDYQDAEAATQAALTQLQEISKLRADISQELGVMMEESTAATPAAAPADRPAKKVQVSLKEREAESADPAEKFSVFRILQNAEKHAPETPDGGDLSVM